MEKDIKTLACEGVSMVFPGVKALSNVDFRVCTGEIRAVVGANGAGKSTLMKIFAGANPGYTGKLYYDGEETELRSTKRAKELGIEVVYQEVDTALFPSQTIAENIMMNHILLGMERKMFVNWKYVRSEAKKVLLELKIDLDVNKLVSELTLAQKQMVLIARSIREGCNFLILDEPTAPLSMSETEELFRVVRKLRDTTCIAVIFITHRLHEVLEICDKVTVMRNGEIVGELDVTPELEVSTIINLMLGRSFDENFPKSDLHPGEVAFVVEGLSDTENFVRDVSLNVREGEIIGLSGLVGAGKTELCKLMFGAMKKSAGTMTYKGKVLSVKNPTDAVNNRMGFVPEERRKEGVLVDESVTHNLSAASLQDYSNNPLRFVNRKAELANAEMYVEKLNIVTPSVYQLVRYLSGGNQQKVAVGKWLSADCDVYIFDEPTKGVDVGAKHDIFRLIQDIAEQGKCVIYATSETAEILSITDRTYVMYDGRITAELVTKDTDEEEIMYYSTGGKKQ